MSRPVVHRETSPAGKQPLIVSTCSRFAFRVCRSWRESGCRRSLWADWWKTLIWVARSPSPKVHETSWSVPALIVFKLCCYFLLCVWCFACNVFSRWPEAEKVTQEEAGFVIEGKERQRFLDICHHPRLKAISFLLDVIAFVWGIKHLNEI